jgi:hypothetical protein
MDRHTIQSRRAIQADAIIEAGKQSNKDKKYCMPYRPVETPKTTIVIEFDYLKDLSSLVDGYPKNYIISIVITPITNGYSATIIFKN